MNDRGVTTNAFPAMTATCIKYVLPVTLLRLIVLHQPKATEKSVLDEITSVVRRRIHREFSLHWALAKLRCSVL